MKNTLFFIITTLFLSNLISCKKALDVTPVSTITNASFWKTEDDVNGGINGMYDKLRVDFNNNIFIWGEARSGDFSSAIAGTLAYDMYYNNFLDIANPGPNWSGLYSTINAANLLLKYIPTISFSSPASKNNALAQAYTMRAYAYFVLIRTYGGVPMRLEATETYDPKTIQKPRSSVNEIFALIKADLSQARSLYSDNSIAAGRDKWSKPGADALTADVYLWTAKVLNGGTNDLDTALTAVNEVQQADVQLLPNYSDIFNYDNKGNKEMIMAVHYQVLESSNNYFINMYLSSSDITSILPQSELNIIGAVGSGSVNSLQVAKYIRDQFSTDDQRREGTFHEVYTKDNQFYTSVVTKGNGTVQSGVRYFMDDIPIYRYADVVLMKAEIENALGQDPSAEMNAIRQRAYGTHYSSHIFINTNKAQNDLAILQERLFEFTAENKRWWDLIRFGKVFDLVPSLQNLKGQDYLLLFPIGNDVISREPLVTENPGWH